MEYIPPRHWIQAPVTKPFARWSADTEQAFLLALRLTGNVRKAAEAIGRSLAVAYKRRQRDLDFATRWDAVVAEIQAAWIAGQGNPATREPDPLAGLRERRDGWNAARRKLFLRVLSETGSVTRAAERARISTRSAYALRRKSPDFAADWDTALTTMGVTLEQAAFERAVEGWEEPVLCGGKMVGTRRRYSDTALRLLWQDAGGGGGSGGSGGGAAARRRRGAAKGDAVQEPAAAPRRRIGKRELERVAREAAKAAGGYFCEKLATEEQTNAALLKKLAILRRQLEAEAAREAARGDAGAGGAAVIDAEAQPAAPPVPVEAAPGASVRRLA